LAPLLEYLRWIGVVPQPATKAHLLSADQLEELRLLTNSEWTPSPPFTGLLLGPPTRRRIKLGAFAASDQRIALRYTLPA
jgi:type II secretory pathway predicted ATPase ExeA